MTLPVRAPRGHVIVTAEEPPKGQLYDKVNRSLGYYLARVVEVGAEVTAVIVGDRVLVQMMSGHKGMGRLLYDALGQRLAVVPVRQPPPSPRYQREYAERKALLLQMTKSGIPTKEQEVEMGLLGARIKEIKETRRRCGRDRLLPPFEDVAIPEGVLAVVED